MEALKISKSAAPILLPRVHRNSGLCKISITGGKGGVGKTAVAVNLAIALSKLGGRVLLIDGDMGLANADQLLGVHAEKTLFEVVKGEVSIRDALLETPFGIHLLPACSGRKEMDEIDEASRTNLIANIDGLKEQFDYVIIDTAAGIGETALNLVSSGDIVLTVVTPDPTSNRDAFSVIKILSKEYGVDRIELVANKTVSVDAGINVYSKISKVISRFLPVTLGLAGVVTRDPCMARSVIERQPLVVAYPNSPASKQILKLATQVVTTVLKKREDAEGSETKGGQSP